jgi:septal ring factor EnvC (AmiA/AmiB activator)|tara:strand:- start:165 stop:371 length:207 start_codon:yes stop_codon:yes gene_type:complete
MAKVIQFPSKVQINRVQRLEQLNEALDRQEQMLQEVMKELDILNEEIVMLTSEYNSMLKELKELVMQT